MTEIVPGKPDTGRATPNHGLPSDLDNANVLDNFVDICILWARAVFAFRPSGSFQWNIKTDESEILIGGQGAEYDEELGRTLPRITVMRSAATMMGLSTSQIAKYSFGSQDGTMLMLDRMALSLVFRVTSRNSDECAKIGMHVLNSLLAMRADIQIASRNAELITQRMQLTAPSAFRGLLPASPNEEFNKVEVIVPVHYAVTVEHNAEGYYEQVRDGFQYHVDALLNSAR